MSEDDTQRMKLPDGQTITVRIKLTINDHTKDVDNVEDRPQAREGWSHRQKWAAVVMIVVLLAWAQAIGDLFT